ncbi:MAG: hypothetical protein IT318_01040 [Anaerolineales bacterium]|nr:hypothetical protein [Anaerolineales bacterium]
MWRTLGAVLAAVAVAAALGLHVLAAGPHPQAPARAGAAPPLALGAELGTGFTYQGQLTKDGVAVTAGCDFVFGLWDEAGSGEPPAGGNQIGGDQALNGVGVVNGRFTATLNAGGEFGPAAFNGEARWLQIGVTCPGDAGATTLGPRQPITPAPYALAVPGSGYANVVVVAKSGGDYTSIQAALDGIGDASADNPYLVWIAPGVYAEAVTMKPFVDIEGAGQLATRITFTGSGANNTGTVVTASNTELRSLTVANTGGAAYAIAIYNNGTAPRLSNITAAASGDGNISAAVFNIAGAAPVIRDATLATNGAGFNHYTLYSINGTTTVTVHDSTITASGGATTNYGVMSTTSSTAVIYHSVLRGGTAAAYMLNGVGRIAGSLLEGGIVASGTGVFTCVGAYDQAFAALNGACQ